MWIKALVPECDFTDKKYPECVAGAEVIAQSASGRYTVIMYAGPEYLKEHKIRPVLRTTAIRRLKPIMESHGGYIDF